MDLNLDGGVIANNPTYIGIVEAHHALGVPLSDIRVLSLGTGHSVFAESNSRRGFGFWYWGSPKARLIDMMFSAQSQNTDNLIKFLNNGLGEGEQSKFYYKRIQHGFQRGDAIRLDETNPAQLKKLESTALLCYKEHGAEVYKHFLTETKRDYEPLKQL